MRKILFLICLIAIPCASLAQTKTSWANLSALRAGQSIQVVDMQSRKHSGTFVNVSGTAISYKGTAGEQTVQKQDLRSVNLMENKHRLRNTLILGGLGAGAGAGIGAAISSCSSSSCIGPSRGKSVGFGLVGGLAIGSIVGALLPSHHKIYSVSSH